MAALDEKGGGGGGGINVSKFKPPPHFDNWKELEAAATGKRKRRGRRNCTPQLYLTEFG